MSTENRKTGPFRFISHRGEKQSISDSGIPVQHSKNPESEHHGEKVSFGVGGMVKMKEMHKPLDQELDKVVGRLRDLQLKLAEEALERAEKEKPDVHAASELVSEKWNEILQEQPERKKQIDELQSRVRELGAKKYGFGSGDKYDLYVGKEGTLIYSLAAGRRPAKELENAYVPLLTEDDMIEDDPTWIPRIKEIRERIGQTVVADIHQIEVLPDYRGKGNAKALVDVALFNIEWTREDIQFSVARVLEKNPDKEKTIAIFQKAGFEVFNIPPDPWDYTTKGYILLLRENPRFKE